MVENLPSLSTAFFSKYNGKLTSLDSSWCTICNLVCRGEKIRAWRRKGNKIKENNEWMDSQMDGWMNNDEEENRNVIGNLPFLVAFL